MVAYSFQKQFIEQIQLRTKQQMIRALRKRHARVGETLQLYFGMRTKVCGKIIPDPVCIGVDEVWIDLSPLVDPKEPTTAAELEAIARLVSLEVNERMIEGAERDALAAADGFDRHTWKSTGEPLSPWAAMVAFWMVEHGAAVFRGVLIRWKDQ